MKINLSNAGAPKPDGEKKTLYITYFYDKKKTQATQKDCKPNKKKSCLFFHT